MLFEWPVASRALQSAARIARIKRRVSARFWRSLALSGCALLSGCAAQPLAAPQANDPAQELLKRYQRTQQMDGASRAQTIAALQARVAAEPTLVNRVELALLLTHPEAAQKDRQSAGALLVSCTSGQTGDALAGLCLFASRMLTNEAELRSLIIVEQSKLQAGAAHAVLQQAQLDALNSQATAKEEAEARRIASLERQLGEQHKQIDSLRRQMRELQAIERSIEERHGSGASP